MPTYTVATTRTLAQTERAAVAEAIADAHTRVTGAGRVFAQIVFLTRDPDTVFVGGATANDQHVFVDATIRGGRPALLVDDLVIEVTAAVVSTLGVEPPSVWVYVRELEPTRMVEYGSVLPAPGAEDAWLSATFGDSTPRSDATH